MRVACLVRARPHHTFFVNRVHARHPVSLVVIERPPATTRLGRVVSRDGAAGVVRLVRDRYFGRAARAARLGERFGDDWRRVHPGIEQVTVANVNDAAALDRLQTLRPDVILDHGTSIVGNDVIRTAGLALNLHWGLSPYYRGVRCTEWALLNWDPYNIGVTIHRLDQRIDGGEIAGQRRVAVVPGDDVEGINHRLTCAGTRIVVELLERLRSGAELSFSSSAPGAGHLYLKKHFSRHLARRIAEIQNSGLLVEMLRTPSRKERLPIHEWTAATTPSLSAV